jgi:hypothetical protein
MARSITFSDVLAEFLPHEGVNGAWVFKARVLSSKTNQFEKEETIGTLR